MCSTHTLPVNIFNLEGGEIMLARDNENFRTHGENWTHDPPNTTSDVPTTEPEGREFDSCLGMEISFVPGEQGRSQEETTTERNTRSVVRNQPYEIF